MRHRMEDMTKVFRQRPSNTFILASAKIVESHSLFETLPVRATSANEHPQYGNTEHTFTPNACGAIFCLKTSMPCWERFKIKRECSPAVWQLWPQIRATVITVQNISLSEHNLSEASPESIQTFSHRLYYPLTTPGEWQKERHSYRME